MAKEKSKDNKKKQKGFKVRFSIKLKFSLAIIFLTAIVIVIMSYYFMENATHTMRENIITSAKREIELLSEITQNALSTEDDIQLIDALRNIKKIKSVKYAHVLNNQNRVLQSTDNKLRDKTLNDKISREAQKYNSSTEILVKDYPDPEQDGKIFDFARPIFHRVYKKRRLATVRLGFSDQIIRDEVKKITRAIIIIAVVFMGLSIVASYFLAWYTTRPLKALSRGVATIGTGDLDYQLKVKTRDEIGQLAEEFNAMTGQLKEAKDKEIENRIMEEQLALAKEIQEGLNPMGFYNKDGIEIKGFTRAAKGVGGDYFDYIDINKNRVGALISDVSGKGVPASLVMVMIRTVFVSAISQTKNIECAQIADLVNNSLSADFAIDKFATFFFMIYDRQAEMIEFANAGHGPLFCYRKSKNKCTVTMVEGVPIGVMDGVEYKQAKVPLYPGDIITLYTDGITEMRNSEKEEYGRLRLQELVIENSQLNADELVDKIVESVDNFRGDVPPHDDMTTLVLKRTE